MRTLRRASEGLARQTSRRSFFGRGADIAFGALAGAAAGTLTRAGGAVAGSSTVCAFPYARPCPCERCQTNGVCAKPCVILTAFYASGCWTGPGSVTCCDCACTDFPTMDGWCGCGSDYHTNPTYCPGA